MSHSSRRPTSFNLSLRDQGLENISKLSLPANLCYFPLQLSSNLHALTITNRYALFQKGIFIISNIEFKKT